MADTVVTKNTVVLVMTTAEARALLSLANFANRTFEDDEKAGWAYIGPATTFAAGRRAIDALTAAIYGS